MPGGLLNIIAYGSTNILVHGNPTKTFLKQFTQNIQILVCEV